MIKKSFFIVLLSSAACFGNVQNAKPFSKVVIWGHKLHSHTHSYIHYAFHKTFKYLGYETHWFDDKDNIENFDFSNALFITEGQVDKKIPVRDDCRYILHNCDQTKYRAILNNGNAILLQVYTHDVLPRDVEKVDDCTYIDKKQKVLYMPWATDLLPHEIDVIKKQIPTIKKEKMVYFVGSYMGGGFDNRVQYDAFSKACGENDVSLKQLRNISPEKNIELIQKSYMAPALQGKWQCDKGYIPCRIFKNISYGQWGITNSKMVYELFKGKIVYNSDAYQLFYDAQRYIENRSLTDLYELMDLVRDRHTYINRINHLLNFLHLIKPLENYTPNSLLS